MKRGDHFEHKHYFDVATGRPLVCRVTQARRDGFIYRAVYRDAPEFTTVLGKPSFIGNDQIARYVGALLDDSALVRRGAADILTLHGERIAESVHVANALAKELDEDEDRAFYKRVSALLWIDLVERNASQAVVS